MKRRCGAVQPSFVTLLWLVSFVALAQGPAPRLSRAIAPSGRMPLLGSRSPRTRTAQDLGRIPSDTVIPGITLVFSRSPAQQAELRQLLADQQNPASPLYHHWLTPDIFAGRFGIASADIATTQTWLQSQGFQIERVARSRDRITFSGNAAQVQEAFGAELHRYSSEGELHIAPASDLSLPADLASITAAVLHLSDFRPKPNVRPLPPATPDYTTSSTQAHYLGPRDIATLYDLNPIWQSGLFGGGQRLALVGQSFVDTSSSSKVHTFQTNLAQYTSITPVLVPGSGVQAISPGDEGESEIDLEYASGIAQNANVFLVYVGANQNYDVFDSLSFAITEDIASVLSISYSICETLLTPPELDQYNALFEQAAAQGQTIVAASGDTGSTQCANYSVSSGLSVAQQQALAVSFPADSPYVTAVGGTQMAPGSYAAGSSSYWGNASTADNLNSLLSYVPEQVWNESSDFKDLIAGGGGSSSYYPRPAWQTGVPGIPSGSYRLLPDIALQASISSPGFIICSGDRTLTGSQSSSCADGLTGSSNQLTIAGGTSFAAPIFAGFIAILNELQHTTGQGNINPVLYRLAAQPAVYAAAFHDITSGSNACLPGFGNCAAPGQSGFAATPGYDEATGLGSLDFYKLATAWPPTSAAHLTNTTILLIANSTSAAPGTTVPVQINVGSVYDPAGPVVPTGTVSIAIDGAVVNPSLGFTSTNTSQANASVTYNFVAPATPGSHLLTVTYAGDAKHAASVGTYSLMVGTVTATGGVTLSANNLTVVNGGTGSTQVFITPSGGYTGRLAWSVSASAGTSSLTACFLINSPPIATATTTAALTIGIGSACNSPLPTGSVMKPFTGTRASFHAPAKTPDRATRAAVACAALLLFGLIAGSRRRTLPPLLSLTLLTLALGSLTGCGGSHSNGVTSPPVVNSYTLTLTGRDSVNASISGSTSFTLIVD